MSDTAVSTSQAASAKQSWWRRWFIEPIRKQLVQGTSPESLAWAAAVGVSVGIVPVIGTVSPISITVCFFSKLNQVVCHLFTRVMLPFHFALIIPFIQLGQQLWGAEPIEVTVAEMGEQFSASPMAFVTDFGLIALRGFSVWLLVAPVVLVVVRYTSAPIFRYFGAKLVKRGEISS